MDANGGVLEVAKFVLPRRHRKMMHLAPEYGDDEVPDRFRALALTYLEAAERLCQQLTDGSWAPNYHRGQVCMWLAFHATELFLKGCIRSVSPGQLKNTHSLGELHLAFSSLFPSVSFELPFGSESMPADPVLMEMALKSDATFHEQLRYPTNKSGWPWGGVRAFAPDLFLADLKELRANIERVSSVVFTNPIC